MAFYILPKSSLAGATLIGANPVDAKLLTELQQIRPSGGVDISKRNPSCHNITGTNLTANTTQSTPTVSGTTD